MMIIAAGFYLIGCVLLFDPSTRLAGILVMVGVVLLHLAELKIAIRIGREYVISVPRIIFMDMLFGFTWWLPLKNGITNYQPISKTDPIR